MEEKEKINCTYITLFMFPKHPSEEFDEDMKLLRLSLDEVARLQSDRDKAENTYSAWVGFEYGKKRIVSVHILAKNISLERHVVRENFFVGDYEYLRFWHPKMSALRALETQEEYDEYLTFLRSVCKQSTTWGNDGSKKN